MLPIILASASPRRKKLLEQIGLGVEVIPADVDETMQRGEPSRIVEELACRKARDVAQRYTKKRPDQDVWILGADTIVVYKDRVMGKPADRKGAIEMLTMLQGDTHCVFTGVCAIKKEGDTLQEVVFSEETRVSIYGMEMWEIERYADTLEPMDKAGAYAVQGIFAKHIRCIEGDYYNVVGLPVARIYQEIFRNR